MDAKPPAKRGPKTRRGPIGLGTKINELPDITRNVAAIFGKAVINATALLESSDAKEILRDRIRPFGAGSEARHAINMMQAVADLVFERNERDLAKLAHVARRAARYENTRNLPAAPSWQELAVFLESLISEDETPPKTRWRVAEQVTFFLLRPPYDHRHVEAVYRLLPHNRAGGKTTTRKRDNKLEHRNARFVEEPETTVIAVLKGLGCPWKTADAVFAATSQRVKRRH